MWNQLVDQMRWIYHPLSSRIDCRSRSRSRIEPLLVGYHLVLQIGAAIIVWWWRPLPLPAPGKYGAVLLLPVVLLAFWAATRHRDAPASAPAVVPETAR